MMIGGQEKNPTRRKTSSQSASPRLDVGESSLVQILAIISGRSPIGIFPAVNDSCRTWDGYLAALISLNTVNPAGDICGIGTSSSILRVEPGIGILQHLFVP